MQPELKGKNDSPRAGLFCIVTLLARYNSFSLLVQSHYDDRLDEFSLVPLDFSHLACEIECKLLCGDRLTFGLI